MALKRNQKITGEILVETEFLFSLREGNSRYGVALKILKAPQQGKLKVDLKLEVKLNSAGGVGGSWGSEVLGGG